MRRGGKIAVECFRSFASTVSPQNKFLQHGSTIPQFWNSTSSCSKCATFTAFSSISRSLVTRVHNPFLVGSRRFYCVGTHNLPDSRIYRNLTRFLLIVVAGSVIWIHVCIGKLETVPYSKRNHFMVVSPTVDRWIGDISFWVWKRRNEKEVLPPTHPDSVRVSMIAMDIIDTLRRGLKEEKVRGDVGNALVPDDKGVQKIWKKGLQRWSQFSTSHFEGLNWEVLVVNDPDVNAFALSNGKIIVNTGTLERYKSNAEIATIIGHEVAHTVGRHITERITYYVWLSILQMILYRFFIFDFFHRVVSLLLCDYLMIKLPFVSQFETEADYIGLLLLASAGYDPRVAPAVYKKLDSGHSDFLRTHPLGRKRAKLLAEAEKMEAALTIYRDVREGERKSVASSSAPIVEE